MKQVVIAFAAMTCFLLALAESSQGQLPTPPQPGISVGFRNKTDQNILVKGFTVVNGMQKPGQILQLRKAGGMAFDANVPPGVRYYTVYNANQPSIILLANFPVQLQKDSFFDIVQSPLNPKILVLVPTTMAP